MEGASLLAARGALRTGVGLVTWNMPRGVQRDLGTPEVMTHDATEALAADRVVVIERGRLVQCGAPEEVYRQPATAEAARLTGPVGFLAAAGGAQLVLRPEDITIEDGGDHEAIVRSARLEGGRWRLGLQAGTTLLWARSPGRLAPGQTIRFSVSDAPWQLPSATV